MAFARVAHKDSDRARCAVVWLDADGRRQQRNAACACRQHKRPCPTARDEAKQLTRELRDQRKDRADVARADVAAVLEAWLASKTMISANGFKKYRTQVNHFREWFAVTLGVPRFYMLTPQHVEAYRDGRFLELRTKARDGHCEKTVRDELATLTQICEWATENPEPQRRYLARNVAKKVERPAVAKPGNCAYTPGQKAAILAAAASDPKLSLMFHLGFYAGLRREGMARLKVADVHLAEPTPFLTVEEKGRATRLGSGDRNKRTVPIVRELAEALRRCPPVAGSGYWFGDLTEQEVENLSAVLCGHIARATGLSGLAARYHNCRHTFVTELCQRTNDLTVAARLAGHVNTRTTERYRSVTTDDMVAAMAKLSNAA